MRKFLVYASVLTLFGVILLSCEKEPGPGGTSSVYGYVHVSEYNANWLILMGEYDGADEDVYIIYGDDISYGDRLRAGPDGKFEFKYLREGKYKVYVYTEDSSQHGLHSKIPVMKEVEITKNHQRVDAGTFEIRRN
jgi:hypothetical protein